MKKWVLVRYMESKFSIIMLNSDYAKNNFLLIIVYYIRNKRYELESKLHTIIVDITSLTYPLECLRAAGLEEAPT